MSESEIIQKKKTPAQIRRALKTVNSRIAKLLIAREKIVDECDHHDVEKVHKANTGNWCEQDDRYWTEFTCNVCHKRWTRDGSL